MRMLSEYGGDLECRWGHGVVEVAALDMVEVGYIYGRDRDRGSKSICWGEG